MSVIFQRPAFSGNQRQADDLPHLSKPRLTSGSLQLGPMPEGAADSDEFKIRRKHHERKQKDRGLLILGLVKTLVGGLIVGGTVSIATHTKFWPMVAIDMLLGVGETFFAKWIVDAKDPASKKILGLSSRVSKAPDIPVEKMTHTEKEQALTPISGLASVISAMFTLITGEALHKHLASHPVTPFEIAKSQGVNKSLKQARFKIQEISKKVKAPRFLAENKIYRVLMGNKYIKSILPTALAALVVGLFEGILTEKVMEEEKKERSIYHQLIAFFK